MKAPFVQGFRRLRAWKENNLLDEFLKTMAKPAILFRKRAGNFLPAP